MKNGTVYNISIIAPPMWGCTEMMGVEYGEQ